mmetsp:Transcript_10051/g.15908  ORF Transcript_10051/g.15908 Transcript_10051/m.15908 type:complete len:226 (-) Transcript_10051:420-1097(-)
MPSTNRTIDWDGNGNKNQFSYECTVWLDTENASHEEKELAKLHKKQTSLAHLRLSLRKEQANENPIAKRKRKLGFVEIRLLDWAVLYGNQKEHNIRHLLDGTKSTSRLELAIKIEWIESAPQTHASDAYNSASTLLPEISLPGQNATGASFDKTQKSTTSLPEQANEESTHDNRWREYKMEEVADNSRKDSVQEALDSSRLSHDENMALINNIVEQVLNTRAMLP